MKKVTDRAKAKAMDQIRDRLLNDDLCFDDTGKRQFAEWVDRLCCDTADDGEKDWKPTE